jgi:hypothetical protein
MSSLFYVDRNKQIQAAKGLTFAAAAALVQKTPVNAVAASGVVTFTGTPLNHVANVQGTGTITVSGTPVNNDELVVNATTFIFKDAPTLATHIAISADHDAQADFIADAINANPLTWVTAVAGVASVVLTANEADAVGTASNLVLTVSATGVTVSGAGTLTGGTNHVHEALMVGTQEYIFKTSGTAQGDVVISANTTTQAENLVTSITRDSTNVTATNNAGVVTVVAAIKGTAGNGIVLSEAAHPVTGLAVSSVTDGKLDGGIDGTVGVANETVADDTYIYHSIATNDTTGTNWRRIALGTVF